MTGTGAKKLSQISWSTSSTGYPRIDTRIDTKTTQGKPVVFSSNMPRSRSTTKDPKFSTSRQIYLVEVPSQVRYR